MQISLSQLGNFVGFEERVEGDVIVELFVFALLKFSLGISFDFEFLPSDSLKREEVIGVCINEVFGKR